jgi:hypothetical protein
MQTMVRPAEPPQLLNDADVVHLALRVLRDPRAWAVVGGPDPDGLTGRRVRARAARLLAEALQTV